MHMIQNNPSWWVKLASWGVKILISCIIVLSLPVVDGYMSSHYPSGNFLHIMCMLHAHNMQTCMENVPNPCTLHAKNMPVTCRDLGCISTRVLAAIVLVMSLMATLRTSSKLKHKQKITPRLINIIESIMYIQFI